MGRRRRRDKGGHKRPWYEQKWRLQLRMWRQEGEDRSLADGKSRDRILEKNKQKKQF